MISDDFDPAYSPSVYMFGGTGLGKTHLSLAIVGEIIKRGYSAIYGSWQGFVSAVGDTARISCMVFMIIAGAVIFGRFLARRRRSE